MKILLVGNYETDGQESMRRFAECLRRELPRHGVAVELLRPEPFLGRLKKSGHGLGKWLGYFDKFVLFPLRLRRAAVAGGADVVHICDHSNAMYVGFLPGDKHLVTCHDLLAVRGALGEDTDCPASWTGKRLQHWILRGLKKSGLVVCDSTATRNDLVRLSGGRARRPPQVVLLGLNQPFRRLSTAGAEARLAALPRLRPPFLLTVGSNLRRKNRAAALRVMGRLKDRWPGQIVFAGEGLTAELRQMKDDLGLGERVVEAERPGHELLEALYNGAHALLYPSRFEGFGWPIIEAQACGCPVICSDRTSLPEVAGTGALIRPVEDEEGFAADVLSLLDPARRATLIERGLENAARFTTERMVGGYVQVYRQLCAA